MIIAGMITNSAIRQEDSLEKKKVALKNPQDRDFVQLLQISPPYNV